MANTVERRRKVKEDRHKRRQALRRTANTTGAINMLSDKNLYQIPYAHLSEISIGDIERLNKKWLKKVKPKKRMTKKEYKGWKHEIMA